MTSTAKPTIELSKISLTKPGVAFIQIVLIGIVDFMEIVFRHGVGVFTGIALCIATVITVRFGRAGTAYVSAATPPLAFAIITFIAIIFTDGMHPSKVGVDFVASLASAAPYLLLSAVYGWINYFRSRKG